MIKANIYDKKLVVENYTVSDSVMFDTVKFTFPDSWNGYTKTAVFKTAEGEIINVVLDIENPLCVNENECYIPYEVIKSPCFYLSVFGVLGESIATTTQVKVPVFQSGYAEGGEPKEPTPTEYQQFINLAIQTKEIAESVRNDANNGLFKGEKGEKGEQGIQGEKGDKGEKGDTGDVSLEYAHNVFAPVIKNTLNGNIVSARDVNSVEHKLSIKLSNQYENLLPYPYTDTTKTVNGITFTDNGDGSITINGTSTGNADFDIVANSADIIALGVLEQREYTISLSDIEYEGLSLGINCVIDQSSVQTYTAKTSLTFAVEYQSDGYYFASLNVEKGYTFDNVTVKPTLGYGKVITDFSGVTVSRYGKNLIPDTLERRVGYYQDTAGSQILSNNKFVSLLRFKCLPNTTYTISSNLVMYTIWEYSEDSWTSSIKRNAEGNSADGQITLTTSANTHYLGISFKNPTPDLGIDALEWCQMEFGSAATDYEPYIEPQTVTANADATVEGLTSVSPNMTVFTDNADALITLTYNADTKLYINNLISQIQ